MGMRGGGVGWSIKCAQCRHKTISPRSLRQRFEHLLHGLRQSHLQLFSLLEEGLDIVSALLGE
eukprot:76385-Lingulodinium_polyedra.AAC.1